MPDDTTAAEAEVEEQENEVEEESTEPEAEETEEESEESEDQEEEAEQEVFELMFGGNKFELPKDAPPEEAVKKVQEFGDGLWSDYTKKSQTLAEEKKTLEAQKEAVQQLTNLTGEKMDAYAKGLAIEQELEQLNQYDLQSLWQSDPDQARKISDYKSQKQAEYDKYYSLVAQKVQEEKQAKDQYHSKMAEEGEKRVKQLAPDFINHEKEVVEYVQNQYGIPKDQAQSWRLNPSAAAMAYKAMKYDQIQSKAKTKTKPKSDPPKPVKPLKGKGGGGPKDPAKMTPEEYRKWWLSREKRKSG